MLMIVASNELVEAVKATWSSDSALKSVITSLQQGNSKNSRYTWSANELRRKGKLVVGNDEQLRLKLISHLHDSPTGGHFGGGVLGVDEGGAGDEGGVGAGGKGKPAGGTLVMGAACGGCSFLDNVYKLHGLPSTIVSDRDKVFLSLFWQSLFKMLKVQLCMSTPYHPQSDGQTKTVNKYVETYLRCMTELVDRTLHAREQVITMLKFHLKAAQDRMKIYADKKRSDRSLQWVTCFPLCDSEGSLAVIPYKILDKKLAKKGNRAVVYGLI
ncbi:reverse transcriptase [Tanacetum coccineum]